MELWPAIHSNQLRTPSHYLQYLALQGSLLSINQTVDSQTSVSRNNPGS